MRKRNWMSALLALVWPIMALSPVQAKPPDLPVDQDVRCVKPNTPRGDIPIDRNQGAIDEPGHREMLWQTKPLGLAPMAAITTSAQAPH